jgi:threonine synthase
MELRAPGVVVSSTGNHGAAIAAYAARASLPCIVFTVASAPSVLKIQMQAYGAMVVALERSADRWPLMKQCADALGWMPMSGYISPPLGSPAFGAEGYKTIAFEIMERWSEAPDFVVVATSYADGLYGVWKGFRELHELGLIQRTPRMVAAESVGSLAATLGARSSTPIDVGRRPTVMFSIGNSIGTFQGLAALHQSGGTAVGTDDESAIGLQVALAKTEGLYAEASAVAGVAAATRLRQEGLIQQHERVVVVMTSSGLKDPDATAKALPSVPVVEPRLNDLREKLRTAYGFAM